MRRLRLAVGLGLGLGAGLLGLSGCGGHGEKEVRADTGPKSVAVTVTPLAKKDVARTVEAVGTLRGWEQIAVGTKREGRVVRVRRDMGDRVRPGEPLADLETTDAQLSLAQAKSKYLAELSKLNLTQDQAEAALKKFGISEELINGPDATKMIEKAPPIVQATVAMEKSQNNLNRQRSLYQRGAGTLEELQNYENDFRAAVATRDNAISTARNVIANAIAAKIAIDSAQQALKDLTVVAPQPSDMPPGVDGAKLAYGVSKRSVSEGQMVKAGEVVAELVIENPLRLWTTVPEQHVNEVRKGQNVRVSVASFPDTEFHGTVARINPSVDPTSRTFQVEVQVPNPEGKLRPGGFAKASLVTDERSEARVVPLDAVLKYAGVTKVYVVEGGKARAVNVETGLEGPGWVEIVGPVPDGAEVVTSGQTQLADGTPVTVRAPEGTAPTSHPTTVPATE